MTYNEFASILKRNRFRKIANSGAFTLGGISIASSLDECEDPDFVMVIDQNSFGSHTMTEKSMGKIIDNALQACHSDLITAINGESSKRDIKRIENRISILNKLNQEF